MNYFYIISSCLAQQQEKLSPLIASSSNNLNENHISNLIEPIGIFDLTNLKK